MNSTKIINSSETHLPAIIEDTFDITLIESGDTKIWKQEVYLQPILGNIHQIIKSEQQKTGKGSTFYFTLPFDEQKAIGIPVINEVEKVNNRIEKTILIVEDDVSSYIFLEIVLNKLGMKTIWAKNGKESINICKENPGIDIVLMDINMPGMSGYEATMEIKKCCPDLPVIAQTACAIAGDREKALEAGCDNYISKPIKKDELEGMIHKYFKK